ALARMSTPRSMRSRASVANFTSLAAILSVPLIFTQPRPEKRAQPAPRRMDFSCGPSFETAAPRPPQDRSALGDHAHDVGLLHDQEVLAVKLHLRARPFAEQHAVAGVEVDRDQLAALVAPARADSDDLAFG